ncbi:MAG TPA: hypothetical protein VF600_09435 [Abditibacteriaceae bacterium]|jgi:hypothetical protein
MKPPIPEPTDTQLHPYYRQELRRIRRAAVRVLLLEWACLAVCSYYVLFLVQQNPAGAPAFISQLLK